MQVTKPEKTSEVSVIQNETNQPMQLSASQQVTGLSLIAEAIHKENFNIEILERLMKMQNDMEEKEAKKSFNQDFSMMMAEIPVIAKTGKNTFNGTVFSKLEDIVEITRPILSKYGFSVTYKQEQEMIAGAKTEPTSIFCNMTVKCILKHRLGHEESNEILLPIATIKGQTPIQAMGMGSTYGRRYTLMQALNIATAGQDNDGSMADFAQVAKAERKPIKDTSLAKAIEKAKDGTIDFMRDLLDQYELTEEQKDFVNGQILEKGQ